MQLVNDQAAVRLQRSRTLHMSGRKKQGSRPRGRVWEQGEGGGGGE
jgi:hypothetical protein